ncbi:MAG: hypothetical protein IPN71_06275 [Fibrobacteres bacterium]|nr:hypothetical protein [Fibrobacterota bacterium]
MGADGSGGTNVPKGLTDVIAFASAGTHTLSLRKDGTVFWWGGSECSNNAEIPQPRITRAVAVATGQTHCVALLSDSSIVSWGSNTYGQSEASKVTKVIAIAAGSSHTVVLRVDGKVSSWGGNYLDERYVPGNLPPITAIAAGRGFSLGLTVDSTVATWGRASRVRQQVCGCGGDRRGIGSRAR